jgi:hypothetical protein
MLRTEQNTRGTNTQRAEKNTQLEVRIVQKVGSEEIGLIASGSAEKSRAVHDLISPGSAG